jgi:hypothetical protein
MIRHFRTLVFAILTVLEVIIPLAKDVSAQTRLGLHVTQEELNIWKQRAQGGPYKSTGDVSTNSPGDWTRINSRANQWASNPTQDAWVGNDSGQAFASPSFVYATCSYGNPCVPKGLLGQAIMNAAFATLVDPANHNHGAAIRTALLNQIAVTGANFTNTTLWPNRNISDGYVGAITQFLTRLAFAYSYVRNLPVFSAADRTAIDTWFSNAAFYWGKQTDFLVREGHFPNRNTEYDTSVNLGNKYPSTSISGETSTAGQIQRFPLYFDCTTKAAGPIASIWHETWSNRSANILQFAAAGSLLNGTLPNDAQTQRWVKMWIKESIIYSTFSQNMNHEFRWQNCSPNNPGCGWDYSSLNLGPLVSIADMFARNGDRSLFDFSTSAGVTFSATPESSTTGGPKSLLGMIQRHSGFVNQRSTQSPNWYGDSTAAHCGNLDWLIQPNDNIAGEMRVSEQNYIMGNLYYQNAAYKQAYMRTLSGAPAYPASPVNIHGPWEGPWGTYPGVLFMFGQMEGKVSPYPTGASQLPSIKLAAVPNAIASGQSSVLTWSTSNATSCTGSGGWTGTIPTSGTQTVTLFQSTTYTLSCTGTVGAASQSTTVTVSTPLTPPDAPPTNLKISP